jgi:hypothetical protein
MSEYFFSVPLDGARCLYLAPLVDQDLELAGQEISDTSGYFLFEKTGMGDGAQVEILAQAVSEEAALRLRDLFKMT